MAIYFSFRKVADKDTGERVVRFDPVTGDKKLVNPATPGDEHEPWPLKGVVFEGDHPQRASIPMKVVNQAVSEGWASRVGEQAVVRPAGRTMNDWNGVNGTPHTFIQASKIIFYMMDGDYVYKVVRNPDKYVASGDDNTKMTPKAYEAGDSTVSWNYVVEFEEVHRKKASNG